MAEIIEFLNKKDIEARIEQLSDEYDDLEDQLLDLEDFAPDKNNKKEYALWQEEYEFIENRMAEIEKEYDELKNKINK